MRHRPRVEGSAVEPVGPYIRADAVREVAYQVRTRSDGRA